MSIVIMATVAGQQPQRMLLRPDQRARIGRSPWSEFCVNDEFLAEEHLEIRYVDPPEIVALHRDLPFVVEGQEHARFLLSPSTQDQICLRAGKTDVTISWSASPHQNTGLGTTEPQYADSALEKFRSQLKDCVEPLTISEEAKAIVQLATSPRALCENLLEESYNSDAFLLACWLSPLPDCVLRMLRALESSSAYMVPDELQNGITQWCDEANDATRNAVVSMCEDHHPSGALRYLVDAIRFSGGSLAPADQPSIPPPPHLPTLCLSASAKILDALDAEFSMQSFLAPLVADLPSEPVTNSQPSLATK